jgi:hypothetical protein
LHGRIIKIVSSDEAAAGQRPPTIAATFDYRSALTKGPTMPLRDIRTAAIMPLLQ